MKEKIGELIKHPLITGSFIIILGSLASSFLNFSYNLFMSRNLSIEDYGTLASLVSLIGIASLPAGALIPTIVRFAASYFAQRKFGKVLGLYHRVAKFTFIVSVCVLGIIVVFIKPISSFLNIHSLLLLIIASFTIFIGFNQTVNMSFLQARLSFGYITFTNFIGSLLKCLLAIALVFSGYGVAGAMIAFSLSYVVPFVLSFFPLRFLLHTKETSLKVDTRELMSFGIPSTITLVALTSFVTTDIMLVKHFATSQQAGIFAGLSLIGRVIFFVSAPIGTVMFPLITQKYEKGEKYDNTLLLAIFLVGAPSILLTFLYSVYPRFFIEFFLKKSEYFSIAPLVGLFGVFITIYAILTILINFFLSIKKTIIVYPVTIAAVAQGLGIWFFHDSFLQIISISLGCSALLLLVLIVYYLKIKKSK